MGDFEGVFLINSTVYGRTTTTHAFVYDSSMTDLQHPGARGALLDNQVGKPIRLIEPSDRQDVKHAREVYDTFFGATTRIHRVFRVTPKKAQKRKRHDADRIDQRKRFRQMGTFPRQAGMIVRPEEYRLVCIMCHREFEGAGHNPRGYRFSNGWAPHSSYGAKKNRVCGACNVTVEKWRGDRG